MSQKQNSNLNEKGKLNIYQNLIKSPIQIRQIKHINFATNYLVNKDKKEEKRYSLGFNNIGQFSRKETTSTKKKNLYIQTDFDSKELPKKKDKRKIDNYRPLFTLTYSKTKILPNERYNKHIANNDLLKESTQELIDLINIDNNNVNKSKLRGM